MAKKSKYIVKYVFLFLTGLFLSNCANQLPPGGGEVDKIPPEIIEVYPASGSIDFHDEYFEIGFSEYVDKRSVQDAIFISPAFEGQPKYSWSGKYVRVYFPETLRDSTTYVVTIGTDLVDYNNKNRMANAYILTFSTGNKIDRRMVTGKVFNNKPDGILIFAYKLKGEQKLLDKKPDYVSQTGKDGSYVLGGLAASDYRIFAVKDEFRDMLFQPEQDLIGVPSRDITLSETDTLYSNLNFFISGADSISPRLLSSVMTDKNHILVNVSEEFDSTLINSPNFFLYDSTANKKYNVLYAYKGNTKPTELVLVTNTNLPLENTVYLFSNTMRDKIGNIYLNDFTPVTLSDKPDTTSATIARTFPQSNTDKADYDRQKFYFQFNDGFDTTKAKSGITFTDTSKIKINFTLKFADDASFIIVPIGKLSSKKDYIIKLDFSKFIDGAGNKLDSVYQYKFKTITGLDFTGVTGLLLNAEYSKKPLLILEGLDEDKPVYKQKINSGGNFNFDRVQPGKYILWAFLDEDSSGTYSYGWPEPFKPAEEFAFYPDTLTLRARWAQSDLKFMFK